jgi:SAM-dependent methyltransferase
MRMTTANAPSGDNQGQYGDSQKLAARARLNARYTIAETGWFPWVADRLPIRPGDDVLDIGCGPAWFWASVAGRLPAAIRLTLADLSPGMVEEAVARCKTLPLARVEGRPADAATLPFEDGRFNGVVAMHMLYHLRDPAAAVAEFHRVLKPGGFLAVTTNGEGNLRKMHELATAVGGSPVDPGAAAFGFGAARSLLSAQFGSVEFSPYPARMCITDPEDLFLALVSYPPGDAADAAQKAALRDAIARAFSDGGGRLDVARETGLFLAIRR